MKCQQKILPSVSTLEFWRKRKMTVNPKRVCEGYLKDFMLKPHSDPPNRLHYRPDRLFPSRTISKRRWACIAFVKRRKVDHRSVGPAVSVTCSRELRDLMSWCRAPTLFIDNFVTAAWLGIINTSRLTVFAFIFALLWERLSWPWSWAAMGERVL